MNCAIINVIRKYFLLKLILSKSNRIKFNLLGGLMSSIRIDKDILKCSINNLTLSEIQVILESNDITVNRKDKKHEVVESILNRLSEGNLSEKLYLDLKTKAFSNDVEFFDGFFYKFNIENVNFNYDSFMKALNSITQNENSFSNTSNITFKHHISNIVHNEENKILKFKFSRQSRKGTYDSIDDGVKYFHNEIKVDIEIYYEIGIVYIHSKNSSESTTIKFILQKAINELLIDKSNKKNRIKLTTPKFDNKIIEKWNKDNKFTNSKISVISIHMLDLLYEFDNEDNNFLDFGIKRLYLEHEVIDSTEDSSISGLIFLGENLQKRNEILIELNKGQRIKGFEIQVNYNYCDLETYEEKIVTVDISITNDNNNSIRVSLSSNSVAKSSILNDIYEQSKIVFLEKLNSKHIKNEENLTLFINKCNEIQQNNSNDEALNDYDIGMVF